MSGKTRIWRAGINLAVYPPEPLKFVGGERIGPKIAVSKAMQNKQINMINLQRAIAKHSESHSYSFLANPSSKVFNIFKGPWYRGEISQLSELFPENNDINELKIKLNQTNNKSLTSLKANLSELNRLRARLSEKTIQKIEDLAAHDLEKTVAIAQGLSLSRNSTSKKYSNHINKYLPLKQNMSKSLTDSERIEFNEELKKLNILEIINKFPNNYVEPAIGDEADKLRDEAKLHVKLLANAQQPDKRPKPYRSIFTPKQLCDTYYNPANKDLSEFCSKYFFVPDDHPLMTVPNNRALISSKVPLKENVSPIPSLSPKLPRESIYLGHLGAPFYRQLHAVLHETGTKAEPRIYISNPCGNVILILTETEIASIINDVESLESAIQLWLKDRLQSQLKKVI